MVLRGSRSRAPMAQTQVHAHAKFAVVSVLAAAKPSGKGAEQNSDGPIHPRFTPPPR